MQMKMPFGNWKYKFSKAKIWRLEKLKWKNLLYVELINMCEQGF